MSSINGEIEIEHNSSIKIWNSTINGELDIVDNSHASLDESTINGTGSQSSSSTGSSKTNYL